MGCTHSQIVEAKQEMGAVAQGIGEIAAAVGEAIPSAAGVSQQISQIASAAGQVLSNSRGGAGDDDDDGDDAQSIQLSREVEKALTDVNDELLKNQVNLCLPLMRELADRHRHDPINSHNWPYYVAEALTAIRSHRSLKRLPAQRKLAVVKACIHRELKDVEQPENADPNDYIVLQAAVVNGIDAVCSTYSDLSSMNDPILKVAREHREGGCGRKHSSIKSNRALTDPQRSRERGGSGAVVATTHVGNAVIGHLIRSRAGLAKKPYTREIANLRERLDGAEKRLTETSNELTAKEIEKNRLLENLTSRAEEARKKYERDLEDVKQEAQRIAQVTYGRSMVPVVVTSTTTSSSSSSSSTPAGVTSPVRQVAAMTSPRRSPGVSPVKNLASRN